MDLDAGRILTGTSMERAAEELLDLVIASPRANLPRAKRRESGN